MSEKRELIAAELETIRGQHGGILRPEDVVKFAKRKTSALHDEFTWDDTDAAKEHRLWQARHVIRVTVQTVPHPSAGEPMQAYVSLKKDRVQPGGGYRSMVEVMSTEEQRIQLVNQALCDFKRLRDKHQRMEELSRIFRAIDKTDEALNPEEE